MAKDTSATFVPGTLTPTNKAEIVHCDGDGAVTSQTHDMIQYGKDFEPCKDSD